MQACAEEWGVRVDRVIETASSIVALGWRDHMPVALKIVRSASDERNAGQVLAAFGGHGVVRVVVHRLGALLMERVTPGTPLSRADVADEHATTILAGVIQQMRPAAPPSDTPSVASFASAFDRYLALDDHRISRDVVRNARAVYLGLCASQGTPRLLHGDLHHDNVLLDDHRGWLAIDPKGVIGETAYEVGAALRNPADRPEVFTDRATLERRVRVFTQVLALHERRVLGWAFSQAVLAALWELEDEGELSAGEGWIRLATSVLALLGLQSTDRSL